MWPLNKDKTALRSPRTPGQWWEARPPAARLAGKLGRPWSSRRSDHATPSRYKNRRI